MLHLDTLQIFFRYSVWANEEVLGAAASLTEESLDRSFDIGRGSLRKTLLHLHAGEDVWLHRWQGLTETPWPDESEKATVETIHARFRATWLQRSRFMATLKAADAENMVAYRDSKGSLFKATLGDMMVQAIVHSTHHRAQAVNMIRRLGGAVVEVDYMMWVRQPAETVVRPA